MLLLKTFNTEFLLLVFLTGCGSAPEWTGLAKKQKDQVPPPTITAPEIPTGPVQESTDSDVALINTADLIRKVNLSPWIATGHHGQSIKIAILDNGFSGLSRSAGKRLPPHLKVEKSAIANEASTEHGTKLAEVLFALTSGSSTWNQSSQSPQIKLYNSNGYSNFKAAVDQAIADQVQIILYSQVWEFGGNFDGKGFINSIVNKATNAGILWINAAGNYASSSWQGAVTTLDRVHAQLPFQNKYVRVVVSEPATAVKISLSWNDFSDSKEWRTSRDLDLVLLNSSLQPIAASRRIQDGIDHGNDEKYSAHARESIEVTLEPGIYLLAVDIKSQNFDSTSLMRLAADGPGVSFIDQGTNASIMIPADNPNVLTVGASDDPVSSKGRTIDGHLKPEVLAPSLIQFEKNISFQGSSAAAAVAAATLAVYMDTCGLKSKDVLVTEILQNKISQSSVQGNIMRLPVSGICQN